VLQNEIEQQTSTSTHISEERRSDCYAEERSITKGKKRLMAQTLYWVLKTKRISLWFNRSNIHGRGEGSTQFIGALYGPEKI
jgi:hypothetical protein